MPLSLGLAIGHLLIGTRPQTGRLVVWVVTPAVVWCGAVLASGRFVDYFNVLVEPVLLASSSLFGYWWPFYWRLAENEEGLRREVVFLLAVSVVACLMGLLFPALGESP